jgi:shikimate dehydrogenase
MTHRYAVVGNPVAHSKSPAIHAAFARQTRQDLVYEAILAPVGGFAETVRRFRAEGGKGLNVTLPFKLEASQLADRLSERARMAEAVNTLTFSASEIQGDNTDGAGLVADLRSNLRYLLEGKRILLMGAGGAARGVLLPLLAQEPSLIVIANRTLAKAEALCAEFAEKARTSGVGHALDACAFQALRGRQFDLIINSTSASINDELPPLPEGVFAREALAYDMMYGKGLTAFLRFAKAQGASALADGLGMLLEQAAESFLVWRGVRPDTAPVLRQLQSSV